MDAAARRLVDDEPAQALGDQPPVEIRPRQRPLVLGPKRPDDLEAVSDRRRKGFVRKRQDPAGAGDPPGFEEMTDTGARDLESIREEAVEPLSPSIGFDLDQRRFHVRRLPRKLPEGGNTSALTHRRAGSPARSTRGTLRPCRCSDPVRR